MKIDLVICGVGGQGVLLSSEILANIALKKGYDVKKSEIHGMAQRGGSVVSFVRISEKVYSPIIPLNCANYMLAFEELEALRYAHFLSPSARVIINTQRINPITVLSGEREYPQDAVERMGRFFKVSAIDAFGKARELGNIKVVNVIMLGALSVLLPFEKELWFSELEMLPRHLVEINKRAFIAGRGLMEELCLK